MFIQINKQFQKSLSDYYLFFFLVDNMITTFSFFLFSSCAAAMDIHVQERDMNITFVTNFSCGSVWKREILMKIGSRWTRNCKNESSQKIMIFFIFCLYRCKKWKKCDFLGSYSSFLIKNHWKIMICGFLWLQKMQKS